MPNGECDDVNFEILERMRLAMGYATRESLKSPAEAHEIAQRAFEEGEAAVMALSGRYCGSYDIRWQALLDTISNLKRCSQRCKRATDSREVCAAFAGASSSTNPTPSSSTATSTSALMPSPTSSSSLSSCTPWYSELQYRSQDGENNRPHKSERTHC